MEYFRKLRRSADKPRLLPGAGEMTDDGIYGNLDSSREFEILANLRMTNSEADNSQRDRISVSSFARQILCRHSPGNSVSSFARQFCRMALFAFLSSGGL